MIDTLNVVDNYDGDGSTLEFTITFDFTSEADVQATVDDVNLGHTIYLPEGSKKGRCVFMVPPKQDAKVVLRRVTPDTQEHDYIENGPFPSDTHEDAVDKRTQVSQEQAEAINRCLKVPFGKNADADLELELLGDKLLGTDGSGNLAQFDKSDPLPDHVHEDNVDLDPYGTYDPGNQRALNVELLARTPSYPREFGDAVDVNYQGTPIYYVTVGGSDSTGNGTFSKPFAGIVKALESASSAPAGRAPIIILGPGVFWIDRTLEIGNGTIIMGQGSGDAEELNHTATMIRTTYRSGPMVRAETEWAHQILLHGLRFDGRDSDGNPLNYPAISMKGAGWRTAAYDVEVRYAKWGWYFDYRLVNMLMSNCTGAYLGVIDGQVSAQSFDVATPANNPTFNIGDKVYIDDPGAGDWRANKPLLYQANQAVPSGTALNYAHWDAIYATGSLEGAFIRMDFTGDTSGTSVLDIRGLQLDNVGRHIFDIDHKGGSPMEIIISGMEHETQRNNNEHWHFASWLPDNYPNYSSPQTEGAKIHWTFNGGVQTSFHSGRSTAGEDYMFRQQARDFSSVAQWQASSAYTSGTITIGEWYEITNNSGGADFTGVGAANNNVGTTFQATGTTPTWGTGELEDAYAIGELAWVLDPFITGELLTQFELKVGLTYEIMDNSGGADFTGVGSADNNVGTTFTATGTAPTWGTGQVRRRYKVYIRRLTTGNTQATYNAAESVLWEDETISRAVLSAENIGRGTSISTDSKNYPTILATFAGWQNLLLNEENDYDHHPNGAANFLATQNGFRFHSAGGNPTQRKKALSVFRQDERYPRFSISSLGSLMFKMNQGEERNATTHPLQKQELEIFPFEDKLVFRYRPASGAEYYYSFDMTSLATQQLVYHGTTHP